MKEGYCIIAFNLGTLQQLLTNRTGILKEHIYSFRDCLLSYATDETSSVDSNGCQVSGFNTQVGSHTFRFTAKDNAGNEAPEQRPISYTVIEQQVVEAITPPEGEEGEEQELHYD